MSIKIVEKEGNLTEPYIRVRFRPDPTGKMRGFGAQTRNTYLRHGSTPQACSAKTASTSPSPGSRSCSRHSNSAPCMSRDRSGRRRLSDSTSNWRSRRAQLRIASSHWSLPSTQYRPSGSIDQTSRVFPCAEGIFICQVPMIAASTVVGSFIEAREARPDRRSQRARDLHVIRVLNGVRPLIGPPGVAAKLPVIFSEHGVPGFARHLGRPRDLRRNRHPSGSAS